ncbi:MAG: hypothetical protein GY722_24900 [bacterium]|nr:hypothetical protein [bacterium]
MQAAGAVVAVLLGAVAVLQAALALGAPWGEHAYGGRAPTTNGRLSSRYRGMSAAAIPILLISAWIVLARSGAVSGGGGWVKVGVWIVLGYLVLNTAANLAAKSNIERFGMGAVTAVAAAVTLVVALG